jgi:hypothetical protein
MDHKIPLKDAEKVDKSNHPLTRGLWMVMMQEEELFPEW